MKLLKLGKKRNVYYHAISFLIGIVSTIFSIPQNNSKLKIYI